jgi:hypothetical protein
MIPDDDNPIGTITDLIHFMYLANLGLKKWGLFREKRSLNSVEYYTKIQFLIFTVPDYNLSGP